MTRGEIEQLLDAYRTGLEHELALLQRLATLAEQQRSSTETRHFERLAADSDERDRVTHQLMGLEETLADVRHRIGGIRAQAAVFPAYHAIVALRRQAADLVSKVLSIDQESMKTLSDAETARRAAMAGLEKGETTLAAYRKVLAPSVAHAAIVDRVG
ncbi:MAG: hypothetical protein AB7I13_03555 [Vicinamibacterales bacterium]